MLAEVVRVGAVDDGVEASLPGHRVETGPQLGLAEVATVGAVPEIARVFHLVGVELDQRDTEPVGQFDRGAPLRFGIGWAPTDRGEEAIRAERPCARDSEERRIHSSRIAEQHLAEAAQVAAEAIDILHASNGPFMVGKRNRILISGERGRWRTRGGANGRGSRYVLRVPDGYLEIVPSLLVPMSELDYRATRSGGPGGQHVNTSSTRIEVWWDVAGSAALTDAQRTRLLSRLATRLDGEGRLRVVASASRSQLRNREAATERLRELVAAALAVPKPRKRTKVSRAAKAARLEAKRRRSATKRDRRGPRHDD